VENISVLQYTSAGNHITIKNCCDDYFMIWSMSADDTVLDRILQRLNDLELRLCEILVAMEISDADASRAIARFIATSPLAHASGRSWPSCLIKPVGSVSDELSGPVRPNAYVESTGVEHWVAPTLG
jgi:hypothetical protein